MVIKYEFLFFKSRLFSEFFNPIKLVITSLEYKYNIFEKLWIVLFIDTWKITENISNNFHFRSGVGVEIRWKSSVGLLKLDLACPMLLHQENKLNSLNFYIGLGPEL